MTLSLQKRKIPLLDLAALHAPLREEILSAITRVVDSQKFIMGPEVKELEALIAEYSGTRYAVACASGSDALFLALLAGGVKQGDRVLTTPYSFFATAGAITRAGATPVFADIDPLTYNLDPIAARRVLETTPGITAMIPVHLFGGCADLDPLIESARQHNCVVIEDGAQSIGAEYKGRKAQSIGAMGCISFFPSKNLGGFGDGGMVLTNDEELARKLGSLRLHGTTKKYYHESIGINSRLDTLQAAILKVKFRYVDEWSAGRQRNAALYRELLTRSVAPVTVPTEASYQTRHVYNQFVVRSRRRDQLKAWLQENGVSTEVYYPVPLHLQPCYRDLGYREGDFPVSEEAARDTLALPVHSALSSDDIEWVCQLISEFNKMGSGA
ncbi:MAG TPA: DegT/DnrJ/EryC1/StrS family aminotransferase [Bryobacteraceae bacterium]|nr:DegT/DnrJ/EryC1/StrS family aminotransferase [Bryobacteraceae bacterium]